MFGIFIFHNLQRDLKTCTKTKICIEAASPGWRQGSPQQARAVPRSGGIWQTPELLPATSPVLTAGTQGSTYLFRQVLQAVPEPSLMLSILLPDQVRNSQALAHGAC